MNSERELAREDLAALLLSDDPAAFLRGVHGERLRWLAAAVVRTCGGGREGMAVMERAPEGSAARVVFEAVLAGRIQGEP